MSASLHVPPERNPGQHDQLRGGIEPVDVGRRIGLGIAELLRVRQDDVHRLVRVGHAAQDVVARAVQDPGDAGQRVARQPFAHAVNQRHAAADGRLEPDLRAALSPASRSSSGPCAASSILLAVTTDAPCSSARRTSA